MSLGVNVAVLLRVDDLFGCENELRRLVNVSVGLSSEGLHVKPTDLAAIGRFTKFENSYIQTLAAAVLGNLASNEMTCMQIMGSSIWKNIAQLLESSNQDVVSNALLFVNNASTHKYALRLMIEDGVVERLSDIVQDWASYEDVVSAAVKPLRNLFLGESDSITTFCKHKGIQKLHRMLEHGSETIRIEAIKVLITMSLKEELVRNIIVASGTVPLIVGLFTSSRECIEQALKSFSILLLNPELKETLFTPSVLVALVDMLLRIQDADVNLEENHSIQNIALNILTNLAQSQHMRLKMAYCGLVSAIPRLLRSSSDQLVETSCRLVRNLALDDENRVELNLNGIAEIVEALLAQTSNQKIQASASQAVANLNLTSEVDTPVYKPAPAPAPSAPNAPLPNQVTVEVSAVDSQSKSKSKSQRSSSHKEHRSKGEKSEHRSGHREHKRESSHRSKTKSDKTERHRAKSDDADRKEHKVTRSRSTETVVDLANAGAKSEAGSQAKSETKLERPTGKHGLKHSPSARVVSQKNIGKDEFLQNEMKNLGEKRKSIDKIDLAQGKFYEVFDSASGLSYFWNPADNSTTWVRPNGAAIEKYVQPAKGGLHRTSSATMSRNDVVTKADAELRGKYLRRAMIAEEILTTERTYTQSLNNCLTAWYKPLIEAAITPEPIISAEEIKKIFSFLEIIANLHNKFFLTLSEYIKGFNEKSCIGRAFLDFWNQPTAILKLYTKYVQEYETAIQTLSVCTTSNKRFAAFVQQQYTAPELKGLNLPSHLIMPVQRVPRYILLLQDLLKNTPNTHADFKDLTEALALTQNVAQRINEAKRDFEGQLKILELQESLDFDGDLVAPNRKYVSEGNFIEVRKGGSDYLYLYLLSDLLVITQQKKPKPGKKQTRKLQRIVPLSSVNRVLEVDESNGLSNACDVIFNDSSETLTIRISAPNPKDKVFFDQLLLSAKAAKQDLLNRKQ